MPTDQITPRRTTPPRPALTQGRPEGPVGIEVVRKQRRRLGRALADVEAAIAAPITEQPDAWWERVRPSVLALQEAFVDHLAATEAPKALHDEILWQAPRLAHAVDRLRGDHVEIRRQIEAFLAEVESQRPLAGVGARRARYAAMGLSSKISRHRQRGADVVFEAFTVDLGSSG